MVYFHSISELVTYAGPTSNRQFRHGDYPADKGEIRTASALADLLNLHLCQKTSFKVRVILCFDIRELNPFWVEVRLLFGAKVKLRPFRPTRVNLLTRWPTDL